MNEPTVEKLKALRLEGLLAGWLEQQKNPKLGDACRQGYRALYRRASRLLHELRLARADGTYQRLLARFARAHVLVIDDFGLAPLDDHDKQDLLEVLEDRYAIGSTIVTSQMPPDKWHEYLGDPTVADAICDRLLNHAHRLALKGPSRRKENTPTDSSD